MDLPQCAVSLDTAQIPPPTSNSVTKLRCAEGFIGLTNQVLSCDNTTLQVEVEACIGKHCTVKEALSETTPLRMTTSGALLTIPKLLRILPRLPVDGDIEITHHCVGTPHRYCSYAQQQQSQRESLHAYRGSKGLFGLMTTS